MKRLLATILCFAMPIRIFAADNGYKVKYDGPTETKRAVWRSSAIRTVPRFGGGCSSLSRPPARQTDSVVELRLYQRHWSARAGEGQAQDVGPGLFAVSGQD